MSGQVPRRGPSDGLAEQERRYVHAKDPSLGLLEDTKRAIGKLRHNTDAAQDLVKALLQSSSYYSLDLPVTNYELPSDIEELFTLRSKRFEVQLFSGIHETDDGRFISLVVLAVPMMGWEVMRLNEEVIKAGKGPDWARGWKDADLETFESDMDAMWSEERMRARELLPILASYEDDPFEDHSGYAKRRGAFIETLRALCTQLPLTVHYSESGNIPKEIPDEWIEPALLEDYRRRLARVETRLASSPDEPNLLYEKAGLLMGRDDLKEAEVLMNKAVRIAPKMPFLWFALADLYSRTGRDKEADKAEAKGEELGKLVEGQRPNRSDIYDLTLPFRRAPEEWTEEEPSDEEVPVCDFCKGDFLNITDGFWYICNRCNRSGPVEGKGLGLTISTEKEDFKVGEPIWVSVILENLTDLEMTYSTDDLEFMSLPPSDEVMDDGEEDYERELVMDWIGKLKAPYATGVLGPHGKETIKIDLRTIETLEPDSESEEGKDIEALFDVPGEHNVSLYMKVTAGSIEDGREPWAESDPVLIVVRKK
jgi:tetratricopeptide (TPR) repeat protein